MRKINLLLLLSLLSIGAYAQTSPGSSDAPGVVVIEKNWSFQIRNPAMDESPFLEIDERLQEEADLRETAAENRRRASLGLNPIKPPQRPRAERKDGPASGAYVYEIKVKNAGEKVIRLLILEYAFFEPNTEKELGRRQFLSKQKIEPGKTKNLVFRTVSPPTGAVNVKDVGKKSRDLYSEKVFIHSIEYADGSTWIAALKNQ